MSPSRPTRCAPRSATPRGGRRPASGRRAARASPTARGSRPADPGPRGRAHGRPSVPPVGGPASSRRFRERTWRPPSTIGRVTEMTETASAWLSQEELESIRGRMPILYVNAVPVRVDDSGVVTRVGLLLRIGADGTVSRALVSGRVLYHERVRDALLRHLEKDLGPVALPQVPPSPQPFTIAEYFPTPGITPYHDPRQHAVSLAYIVPVAGDCRPRQDALDLVWFTPEEAASPAVQQEMTGGQGVLLKQALAHVGRLP